MKLRTKLAGVALAALVVGQIGVAGAGKTGKILEPSGPGTPGITQAGNIEFVANIGDTTGWSGSDIEFASREVVKLSNGATGTPVCKTFAADGVTCVELAKEVRDFAIAGGYGQPGRIIDITNPATPVHVNNTPCNISQNDIQIKGNLLLVAADGNGSCTRPGQSPAAFAGSAVLDFTDPRNPTYLSRLQYPSRGSHNHTIHPTKPFVYLSDSDVASAGLGNVPIWNITDPANPVLAMEFKHLAHSPHDITFNADGSRAYVAAVSASYILNTENPASPVLISTIANEGISIAHQADPTPDGDYLLVTDELGGGAGGLSPGGPVHVYDIRNEAAPVKVGIIEDDCVVVSTTCDATPAPAADVPVATAHVLRINPDGYTMAIAWYKDGVHVIDYSDIRGGNAVGSGNATGVSARTIGRMKMPGANTWAAKMWQERHPGYVFANDINRGFDVFYVSSMGPGYMASGTIHAGHQVNYQAGVGVTRADWETNCDHSPLTNGVDGWVQALPAGYDDGTKQLTATPRVAPAAGYDLDLYFYDGACGLTGAFETSEVDESAVIPSGSKYVLVTSYVENPVTIPIILKTSQAPPEE